MVCAAGRTDGDWNWTKTLKMNKSSQLLHESKLSSIIHTVHFYTTAWPIWDGCLSVMNILMCWAAFVCWLWYIQEIYIWSQICLRRWRDAGYRLSASSSHGCENISDTVWLIQDFKYKYCADKSLNRLSAAVWPSEKLLKSVVMCLKVTKTESDRCCLKVSAAQQMSKGTKEKLQALYL